MEHDPWAGAPEPEQQTEKPKPVPTDAKAEIKAMSAAYEALKALDPNARYRAMRWLDSRLSAQFADEEPPF